MDRKNSIRNIFERISFLFPFTLCTKGDSKNSEILQFLVGIYKPGSNSDQ